MDSDVKKVIKVLVVDDSAFMRRVVSDILKSDEHIAVIDTAANGNEALKKAKQFNPDVITLDIEMPGMDGLTCLRELLIDQFIPVVMLSSLTKEGAEATIQALEYGAVDFITKPVNIFEMSGEEKRLELIEKVKIASSIPITKKDINKEVIVRKKNNETNNNIIKNIVAIGTSTGGPKALQDVIPIIPGNAPAAYLVVQHMPAGFTKSLADRLNSMSEVTVKEAEDEEIVCAGFVYIAPGNHHMLVKRNRAGDLVIKLTQSPPIVGLRPSVNVMLKSLSETGLKNIIGVIMTGMGGDGTEGLKKIKEVNNGYIIAQDEESSTVFGMPKVAIRAGIVDAIVPLKEITKEIMKIVEVQI